MNVVYVWKNTGVGLQIVMPLPGEVHKYADPFSDRCQIVTLRSNGLREVLS